MYDVYLLNRNQNIVYIKFYGLVCSEHIPFSREEMMEKIENFSNKNWKLLIDLSSDLSFGENAKKLLLEQPFLLKEKGLIRAAIILNEKTKNEFFDNIESLTIRQFSDHKEAIDYLSQF